MQKGIALATCMAIVMGLFTGCGNKNDQQIAASPDDSKETWPSAPPATRKCNSSPERKIWLIFLSFHSSGSESSVSTYRLSALHQVTLRSADRSYSQTRWTVPWRSPYRLPVRSFLHVIVVKVVSVSHLNIQSLPVICKFAIPQLFLTGKYSGFFFKINSRSWFKMPLAPL